jgi:hypothetical protein
VNHAPASNIGASKASPTHRAAAKSPLPGLLAADAVSVFLYVQPHTYSDFVSFFGGVIRIVTFACVTGSCNTGSCNSCSCTELARHWDVSYDNCVSTDSVFVRVLTHSDTRNPRLLVTWYSNLLTHDYW